MNYFISEKKCKKRISKEQNLYDDIVIYFQKFSKCLLKSNYELIESNRKIGIKLQLQKMAYNTTEVHLIFEIKNKSQINFEIDYLKVYINNGNKKRKASFQRLEQSVVHQCQFTNEMKTR